MGKCCDPQAPRPVMVDVGGARVGILGLEEVLAEVRRLHLADEARIKQELLGRVKRQNYVAPGTEEKYAAALYELYRERYPAGRGVAVHRR